MPVIPDAPWGTTASVKAPGATLQSQQHRGTGLAKIVSALGVAWAPDLAHPRDGATETPALVGKAVCVTNLGAVSSPYWRSGRMAGIQEKLRALGKLVRQFIDVFLSQPENVRSDWAQGSLLPECTRLKAGELLVQNSETGLLEVEPVYVREELCVEIASQISEVLSGDMGSPDAEGIWTMLWFALEHRDTHLSPDTLTDRLVEELRSAPRLWSFDARVGMCSTMNLETVVGGTQELEVYCAYGRDPRGIAELRLKGKVWAHTRDAARTAAEETVLSVMGAGFSIGLISLTPNVHIDQSFQLVLEYADQHPQRAWEAKRPADDFLTHGTQAILAGCCSDYPRDLSDVEFEAIRRGKPVGSVIQRHERLLRAAMASDSSRAREIRTASRLALIAAATPEYGHAITLAFSVVEGLLLEAEHKDNVLARLTEAVAHALGTTSEDRKRLRTATKQLYDHRSTFVHTGRARETARSRRHAIELMTRVLRREMASLLGSSLPA